MLKILCVCNGAHVRSVTLARLLRKRGLEVLTCGVNKGFSDDTIAMLFKWADVIYIQKDSLVKLHARFDYATIANWTDWSSKLDTRFDVGPDDWKVPQHPDLLRIMREMVERDMPQRESQRSDWHYYGSTNHPAHPHPKSDCSQAYCGPRSVPAS